MLKEQIIKARKEQGYTQGSLASKIGVRQATISEFESGKRSLHSDILEKILQTLEINIMNTIEEKKMQLELSNNQANDAEQSSINCNIPLVIKSVCKYGMNPDDCIRKADTCFDCLKDS